MRQCGQLQEPGPIREQLFPSRQGRQNKVDPLPGTIVYVLHIQVRSRSSEGSRRTCRTSRTLAPCIRQVQVCQSSIACTFDLLEACLKCATVISVLKFVLDKEMAHGRIGAPLRVMPSDRQAGQAIVLQILVRLFAVGQRGRREEAKKAKTALVVTWPYGFV